MKLKPGPEQRGQRLDHYLAVQLTGQTRSQVQALNRSGAVHVYGRVEKSGYRIRGAETIEVEIPAAPPSNLIPEEIPLQVYFEDADLAVIEKPAGLVVHPGAGARQGTLVHGLLHRFGQLSDSGGASRPGIVHRIDKGTSGLLVIAKNNVAHAVLSKAFEKREVEKRYLALVHGRMSKPSGSIEIGRAHV